jgi:hypothetical protein
LSTGGDRLRTLYRGLDADGRRLLLEFAEFLAARRDEAVPEPDAAPRAIPRPDDESVVAALKRLRATYPMLDSASLLDAAATLVTAHVLHGRAAGEVIDELETLFGKAYAAHQEPAQKTS